MQPYPGCTRASILIHPLLVSIAFSAGGGAIYIVPFHSLFFPVTQALMLHWSKLVYTLHRSPKLIALKVLIEIVPVVAYYPH